MYSNTNSALGKVQQTTPSSPEDPITTTKGNFGTQCFPPARLLEPNHSIPIPMEHSSIFLGEIYPLETDKQDYHLC